MLMCTRRAIHRTRKIDAESSVRHMNRSVASMARDAKSLPTEHREVTLTEFRASIGGVTAADKPKQGSEKMPVL